MWRSYRSQPIDIDRKVPLTSKNGVQNSNIPKNKKRSSEVIRGYKDWIICPFFIENIWMAKTGIVYFGTSSEWGRGMFSNKTGMWSNLRKGQLGVKNNYFCNNSRIKCLWGLGVALLWSTSRSASGLPKNRFLTPNWPLMTLDHMTVIFQNVPPLHLDLALKYEPCATFLHRVITFLIH